MFIYLYTLGDYSGSSNTYLCHDTIGPTEFEALVEKLERDAIPEAIQREKDMQKMIYEDGMKRVEEGAYDPETKTAGRTRGRLKRKGSVETERDRMRQYFQEKYDGEYEINWDDIYNVLVEQLIELGFQLYEFDAVIYRASYDTITTCRRDE
jgi:hypothetical protein